MADREFRGNPEHLEILREGADAWNTWRDRYLHSAAELNGADLSDLDLKGANLRISNLQDSNLNDTDLTLAHLVGADLSGATLINATLYRANCKDAILVRADLSDSDIAEADLSGVNLRLAILKGAYLGDTNLSNANLTCANLEKAYLGSTVLANIDFSQASGLDACIHNSSSTIDHRTLARSGPLPLAFLRGCGLPDLLIEYLPSMSGQAIRFYSCFISHASKEEDFAKRLYADLQNNGVRCWFAPEDMKIGGKILDTIDQTIRVHDKLLLILSGASIASRWVEDEVTKAFAEERSRNQVVLFPIRIDDAALETDRPWAVKLRDSRHIGDFTSWKDHDSYKKAFDRLLRDLRVEGDGDSDS